MSLKDQWDLETALKVLQHPTVDAKTWAEAVEWLLKHGPSSIRKILIEASNTATEMQFPEIKAAYYTSEGQPVYDTRALSEILDMPEDEVQEMLNEKGDSDNSLADLDLFPNSSKTVH
jgi:alpha-galactosidase